jgi:hypothetical protein
MRSLHEQAPARALVDPRGLGASSSTPVFRAVRGGLTRLHYGFAAAIPAAILLEVIGLRFARDLLPWILGVVPLWVALQSAAFATKVSLRVDGMLVTSIGLRTFIGYTDIEAITQEHDDLVFASRDGTTLRLGFPDARWLTGARRRPTAVLLARLRDACSALAA